ncbi:MAG TPA: alpha/beta hydrolase [Gemmatimonadaceae bacterium]|nr:alpha/beta hydrolase [Gemmatimonadaceae bacterium]
MNRRHFVQLNAVALGGLALDACARARSVASLSETSQPPTDATSFARARQFATTPFGEIAHVAHGRGPTALFLHGYPLNGFQWRGAIDRLHSVRRCVAPDLMGLGLSDVPASQAITPEAQALMLVAFLDRLGVDACDVVANDSGGMIAQLLVMQFPRRVRSLLLTNCDTQNDCPPPSFQPFVRLARTGGLADKTIAPALADKSGARSARGIGGIGYSNPLNPTDETIETYFAPIVSSEKRKAQYDALTIGLGDNTLASSADQLRKFEGPVRIVWGADDTVFAKTSPEWLGEVFPNSRGVRRVEHAKLFFPEEQPDVIAAEALSLWNA